MLKKILWVVVGLVVLLVLAVGIAFFYIDTIAQKAIERGGSYTLGVKTTLNSAHVGIFSGEFDLKGLKIDNPEGFKTPHFVTLSQGEMAVTLGSLMEETVEAPRLVLSGIHINLEKQGGKANYEVISENAAGSSPRQDTQQQSKKKFVIREILITDVTVHTALLPVPGKLTEVDLKVDKIALKDVGSDTGSGVLISELMPIVIQAVLKAAVEKGAGVLPPEISGTLAKSVGEFGKIGEMGVKVLGDGGKIIGDLGGGAAQGVGGAGKAVGEEAGKVLEGVGGLFNKKEKKPQTQPSR